jgi:hypothetical protein
MAGGLVLSTSAKATSASTAPTASASRTETAPRVTGPLRRALDVAVELAVGDVVDAAAGAAHQHRAGTNTSSRCQPGQPSAAIHSAQRGPQQQQPAGRAVPADEVQVQAQAA